MVGEWGGGREGVSWGVKGRGLFCMSTVKFLRFGSCGNCCCFLRNRAHIIVTLRPIRHAFEINLNHGGLDEGGGGGSNVACRF